MVSTDMHDLAEHLLNEEIAAGESSKLTVSVVLRVSEKLRRTLCASVGVTDYRLCLSRALTLAKADFPRLSAVQVRADGALEGIGETETADFRDEGAVLIAQLLGLFLLFLGVPLTLRLLQDVSPHLSFTTKSGAPMPFESILREVEQLNKVSERLEALAEQHSSVEAALMTISGNIRNTATTLDVLTLVKDPSKTPRKSVSKQESKRYLM
jgi:hypothetical protein